ncbi:hypothetical protein RA210_U460005 [Rubrivivax sp. A210]|nr:hypothetical protein RA210_U460005 [Rubrivivax sp. A210]
MCPSQGYPKSSDGAASLQHCKTQLEMSYKLSSTPLRPNPSLNRTSYGRPPWPELRYAVHSLSSGQGVLPPLAG